MVTKVPPHLFRCHGEWSILVAVLLLLNQLFALTSRGDLLTHWCLRAWGLALVISESVIGSGLFDYVCQINGLVATLCQIHICHWLFVLSSILASFANALASLHKVGGLGHVIVRLVAYRRKLVLKILAASTSFWSLNYQSHICCSCICYRLRKCSNVWNGEIVWKWHLWMWRSYLTEDITIGIWIKHESSRICARLIVLSPIQVFDISIISLALLNLKVWILLILLILFRCWHFLTWVITLLACISYLSWAIWSWRNWRVWIMVLVNIVGKLTASQILLLVWYMTVLAKL